MINDYLDLIEEASKQFGLDPKIVQAVVITESDGDMWSYRLEPSYAYLVNPRDWAAKNSVSLDSEIALQKTSIGLMQPMGGVCREWGFQDKLSEIFQPRLSLYYGCRHLLSKAQKYGTDPATMYAAYNAGSIIKTLGGMFINQRNVDRFMTNYNKLSPT